MSAPAALPLFGDAYLADTSHLSLEEHGAYLKLLMIAWRSPDCALPDDDRRLATILGCTTKKWAALKPAVMAFWTQTEKGWEQKRLSKERAWVKEKSAKSRAAALARHGDHATNPFPAGTKSSSDVSNSPARNRTDKCLINNNTGDANADADADANGYAPPPPPNEISVDVSSSSSEKSHQAQPDRRAAFAGKVVRLREATLTEWRRTYHAIPDLGAELSAIDEWLANEPKDRQAKWVHLAKSSLNRRHQDWLARRAPTTAQGVPSLRELAPAL